VARDGGCSPDRLPAAAKASTALAPAKASSTPLAAKTSATPRAAPSADSSPSTASQLGDPFLSCADKKGKEALGVKGFTVYVKLV
jgi:hypothetical protein